MYLDQLCIKMMNLLSTKGHGELMVVACLLVCEREREVLSVCEMFQGKWYIEDPTGTVQLDLSQAISFVAHSHGSIYLITSDFPSSSVTPPPPPFCCCCFLVVVFGVGG